ncbi:hypothetical protein DFH07DRAFT_964814 [Mycena maculata]|uniref:Uncharacterized protein n=1 Tax=Mycena maculata TaxID=230809 RepID=A0AAD7N2M9_9AGAR|nr:hypothetical protein DFH07DRAFT_964814 [Mycena maculata]
MHAALLAEKETSDDKDAPRGKKCRAKSDGNAKGRGKGKGKEKQTEESDDEEATYSGAADSGSESDSDPEVVITHELAEGLPTKTVPTGGSRYRTQLPKKKKKRIQPDPNADTSNSAEPTNSAGPNTVDTETEDRYRNPICNFFENVTGTNHGRTSVKDKFYHCLHGEKVLKISKAMHSSLNGLTGHLTLGATIEALERQVQCVHVVRTTV